MGVRRNFYGYQYRQLAGVCKNNMRFIKLQTPIRDYYSWKGNTYIDTYSINSEVKYLDDWDYVYDSVNVPLTFGHLP